MKLKALCLGMGLLCSLSSFAATELRYGVEAEYPPFESRNAAGELEGFDIELGNAICKAAQLKCSWVETSFDALIPGLTAKKFDAINSAMNITEQRRKSIDFTQPIYRIPSQLVGKSGDGMEATAEGLKGKTIGVLQGSIQETYAKEHWEKHGVTVVSYKDQNMAWGDLLNGRIDASLVMSAAGQAGFLSKPQGKGLALLANRYRTIRSSAAASVLGCAKVTMRQKNSLMPPLIKSALTAPSKVWRKSTSPVLMLA